MFCFVLFFKMKGLLVESSLLFLAKSLALIERVTLGMVDLGNLVAAVTA